MQLKLGSNTERLERVRLTALTYDRLNNSRWRPSGSAEDYLEVQVGLALSLVPLSLLRPLLLFNVAIGGTIGDGNTMVPAAQEEDGLVIIPSTWTSEELLSVVAEPIALASQCTVRCLMTAGGPLPSSFVIYLFTAGGPNGLDLMGVCYVPEGSSGNTLRAFLFLPNNESRETESFAFAAGDGIDLQANAATGVVSMVLRKANGIVAPLLQGVSVGYAENGQATYMAAMTAQTPMEGFEVPASTWRMSYSSV